MGSLGLKSLSRRLKFALGVSVTLCWALALGALFIYLRNSESGIWDDKLQAIATKILLAIPQDDDDDGPHTPGEGLKLRSPVAAHNQRNEHLAFQIWDREALWLRTPGAPESPLQPSFAEGFASTVIGGERWRVYSISDSEGRIQVQVGNLHSIIDRELRTKAFVALGLSTLMLLLAGTLMHYSVRVSLRPINQIAAAVLSRQKFDLAPLPVTPLPTELQPLIESFNHVLGQLDQAIAAERRFIGDAAHELRTPLSALQAQAQVALRAGTLADKDAALVKLLAVADRSTRLSEQLLDLARLDAGVHCAHQEQADLSELIMHVVSEFDIYASQRHRSLVLATTPCRIDCDVDEIGILLRNLIDNALRYTAEGGCVRIGCGLEPGEVLAYVEVADDGPGVPESQRLAIFDRFHRVAGSGERGSGIGLSLVAGIARLHRASIVTGVGLDGRGLAVRIRFPAAPAA